MRLHVDEQLVAAERRLRGVDVERGFGRHTVVLVAELGVEGEQSGGGADPARRVERLRSRERSRSGSDLFGDVRADTAITFGERKRRVLVGAPPLEQDRERRGCWSPCQSIHGSMTTLPTARRSASAASASPT